VEKYKSGKVEKWKEGGEGKEKVKRIEGGKGMLKALFRTGWNP